MKAMDWKNVRLRLAACGLAVSLLVPGMLAASGGAGADPVILVTGFGETTIPL